MDKRTCSFEGCGRPAVARNLCNSHNIQYRSGVELRPIRSKRPNGSVGTSTCEFPECGRVDWKRGLCIGHYQQVATGRPLKTLKVYMPDGAPAATVRDELGRKKCPRCLEWLPVSDFFRSKREPDGLFFCCKGCDKPSGRRTVYRRHSITAEQYEALLESQGGTCAICKESCPRGSLAVDHDHSCCPGQASCGQCVRGLLCRNCNHGIGLLKDSPELLRAGLNYLENSSITPSPAP